MKFRYAATLAVIGVLVQLSQRTDSAQEPKISGTQLAVNVGVTPPMVMHFVTPKFTKEARKNHISGIVTVDLVVDEEGHPTAAHVVHGLGAGLDEEAINAIKQYRFLPAKKDGLPVKVELTVSVNFRP